MKRQRILTQVSILLAGILAGFLIGRISFRADTPAPVPPQTMETAKDTGRPAAANSETYLKPKVFETVANVSADDDPAIGSAGAPLTVIEFTDYQCLFCKKHALETFGRLKEAYADTGKIRYVVRDFPLREHPQAMLAAMSAGCALEQNKFWEMHDLLFAEQDSWSYQGDAAAVMKKFAERLGLDKDRFSDCLDKGKYETEISRDIADGELYKIAFTPTVFVGDKKIIGAQPYDTFRNIIDSELNKLWQTQEM